MKCSSLIAAAVAGAALLTSLPATAQTVPQTPVTTPVNPGFFYWSIGANGGIRHLPQWSYGQFVQQMGMGSTLLSGYTYDPKPFGAGPEFVMGYALNKAGPLGGVGDRPRIELGLSTFFGRTTQSDSQDGADINYSLPFVDGSGALHFLRPGVAAKLETTVYAGETALRFKTEYKLNPRFQVVPSIAAIGGMAFYRYKWESNFVGFDFENVTARVKETIRSWHVGVEAALQLNWTPGPRWSVSGGVSIAGMHRRSDMRGLSQFSRDFGFGGDSFINNASDNDNTFAWRLGLNLGVTYDWGWARLTLSGFGYYDSAVPGIDNPTSSTAFGDLSPARLTHNGEWAYGGRIAIVFPLYKQRY